MLDLVSAVNLPGWMTYEELVWLAKQAQKHERIVEIGCYQGKSTRALADNTKGFVVAVDNFKGPNDVSLPRFMRDNLLEMFIMGTTDLIQAKKVIPIVADHADINIDFSPDMVFLDGSHVYEDIKRDIELWKPRIVKGGILCGHDYTNIEDVRQATADTLGRVKLARGTSIWYV